MYVPTMVASTRLNITFIRTLSVLRYVILIYIDMRST